MKRIVLAAISLAFACTPPAIAPRVEISAENIKIIPKPVSVKRFEGEFVLDRETQIVTNDEAGKRPANLLTWELADRGVSLEIRERQDNRNSIVFTTNDGMAESESYEISIQSDVVQVTGSQTGLLHGAQTLLQLIPLESENSFSLPLVEIKDTPRFKYRGMHLDVARHFFDVEFIKRYIRLIARYKFNYFHWHLTDDQGWRIAISKYPKLTDVGSKRRETVVGKYYRPYRGDGIPVEGQYKRDDVKEVLAYARAHGITIIPEIDIPGHSSAALAAYPELGCRDGSTYSVKTTWGGFSDVLCPKESTVEFLENVLDEIVDLFENPPYIHLGGDEVDLSHWKDSPDAKRIKTQHNLRSDFEVKGWFLNRIARTLSDKGVQAIFWDDVLGSGVSSESTIMVWQSKERLSPAIRAGHSVIMTPWRSTYFDHPQGDPETEPLALGEPVTLDDVYMFDPTLGVARNGNHEKVLGGQGCVWTEFIKTGEHVEFMMFPRAIALSEALWSRSSDKNVGDFRRRLAYELYRLDLEGTNFRIPEPYGLRNTIVSGDERIVVNVETPIDGSDVFITTDGTEPTNRSQRYMGPFLLKIEPGNTMSVKAKAFSSSGRQGSVAEGKYSRFRNRGMLGF